MSDLTDFLLARIGEDEETAIAKLPFGQARVLAECEAKRLIVEELRELIDYDRDRFIVSPQVEVVATRTMTYLALPYADHPDYREEWKP